MAVLDILHSGSVFFFFRFKDHIRVIDADDRAIGRDLHYIHPVDLLELVLLCLRCTCHAGFLLVFIEVILEGNCRQRLALPLDLHILFCFYGLMKSVGVAAPWHKTPRELIDNHNLPILDHIVLVPEHEISRLQRDVHMVGDLRIFRVTEIGQAEILLNLFHPIRRQAASFLLLVHDEVAFLLDFLLHQLRQLGLFPDDTALLHPRCQHIRLLIQGGGFSAAPGYNQGGSGFIDQNGVHLINDGVL